MQIIFVFVRFTFTQGNHHDFVFAEEESVEKKGPVKLFPVKPVFSVELSES